jgi:hypothetical protein
MIAFWNRKEVYMGYSLETLEKGISVLKKNHVDYKFKYQNMGTFALANQNGNPCYLYVHKKDAEQASILLYNAGIKYMVL